MRSAVVFVVQEHRHKNLRDLYRTTGVAVLRCTMHNSSRARVFGFVGVTEIYEEDAAAVLRLGSSPVVVQVYIYNICGICLSI